MSGLELVSRSTYVCQLVMLPLFDTIIKQPHEFLILMQEDYVGFV